MPKLKRVPAAFYQTSTGREPVRDWLRGLDEGSRKVVGQDIATAEFGWPVGMPLARNLGGGLHEIRSNITDSRIARVIFTVHKNRMVLLHGFVKKTQKTPKADLELAKTRAREIGS
jgi:phage-related protein